MTDERRVRAIRGATTLEQGEISPEGVISATRALLREIVRANDLEPHEVISAIFTVTMDLQVAFPAEAARDLGWRDVPLLCATEIAVPGALPHCVRVLLHVEQSTTPQHIYLGRARELRPDLRYE